MTDKQNPAHFAFSDAVRELLSIINTLTPPLDTDPHDIHFCQTVLKVLHTYTPYGYQGDNRNLAHHCLTVMAIYGLAETHKALFDVLTDLKARLSHTS